MRLVRGVVAASVVCGAALGGGAWWLDVVGTRAEGPVPAGCAIVVLGARVDEGGVASPTLEARARHGAALAQREGLLVFSGGVGDHPPSEASVGRAIAIDAGVPAARILVEEQSHSTRENATETAALLRARHVECVHLVSDPYHLARAAWLFEREGLRVTHGPVFDAPRHRSAALRVWWTLREVPAFVRVWLTR